MKIYPYVILGGGAIAGYAARAFVAHGLEPQALCIISAEPHLPYNHAELGQALQHNISPCTERLINELWINDAAFYAEHGIDLRLATPIEQVDFINQRLYSADESIGYAKLLIATGARSRPLAVPGDELAGLHQLCTLEDAQALQQAASHAQHAVVIGHTLRAMAIATVLHALGVATTIVYPTAHLGTAYFTDRLAEFFERAYAAQGIALKRQSRVLGLYGAADQITHVSLVEGGGRAVDLPAELVVAEVGQGPAVELFSNSDLQLDDGIIVNHFLETNLPNHYAAGAVARYPDPFFQDKLRTVGWATTARAQGQQVAATMLGQPAAFTQLPHHAGQLLALRYEYWGDPEAAETVIYRGNLTAGTVSIWWLAPTARLLAAFVMNRPAEEGLWAQQWIRSGTCLNPFILRDERQSLHRAAT